MPDVSSSVPRVLIVEDDRAHAVLIEDALADLRPHVAHAATAGEAFRLLAGRRFDLAILDVRLPDASGFEIHRWAKERADSPPIVFVTADDSLEHAVDALRLGAVHYVVKRRNYLRRVVEVVTEVLSGGQSTSETSDRSRALSDDVLIGESTVAVEIRRRVADFAASDATVLITGETGTGKEVAARAIHRASRRSEARFVALNCSGISDRVLEGALVEVVGPPSLQTQSNGIDLREAARGGTLFLDEIGDVALPGQGKFLRLLEGPCSESVGDDRLPDCGVRVIAATRHNLERMVALGEFREDLYHRLNVLRIHVPPLRERRCDIPALANHFLKRFTRADRRPVLTQEALAQLMGAVWPGNVRELEHAIQRTLASWTVGPIYHCDLGPLPAEIASSYEERVPRRELVGLLLQHRGRLGLVAQRLGVSVRTVQRRMSDYGLVLRDFRVRRRD